MGNAALGNRVEEEIVVDRRKTAVKGQHRLDVRVIVRRFPLQVGREETELFGDELLKRIPDSIFQAGISPSANPPTVRSV